MTKEEEIEAAWSLHDRQRLFIADARVNWLTIRHEEQQGRCAYCECETVIQKDGVTVDLDIRATVDHVVARSAGGEDTFENVVCACATCNTIKGDGTVEMLLSSPRFRVRLYELANRF
jgi:5-methylcytosine-specific restriction endonuclease McrA